MRNTSAVSSTTALAQWLVGRNRANATVSFKSSRATEATEQLKV